MDRPSTPPSGDTRRRDSGLLSRIYWLFVGVLAAIGIGGILTIGLPLIALAMLLAVVGALMPGTRNRSANLLIAGLSAGPFLIAWLNRDGPGTVCQTFGEELECIEEWSPWPFAAVGAALVTIGVLLARRRPRWDGPQQSAHPNV